MGIDGLGLSNNLANNASGNSYGPATGQTGVFRGEQVRVLDMQSTLADAAEEITMAYSEKVEDKELAERKVDGDAHARGMSAEEVATYLAQSHADGDPQELARLVARLLSGQEPPKNVARQFSGDVTQQFVLLQHALQQGRSGGADPEVLEQLQDAATDLAMEHDAAIQAGLNICRAAGEFAHDRTGVERFQAAYRDVVLGGESLAGVLKTLLERLDSDDGAAFTKGLSAMIRSLGDDLSAQRPSADPRRMQVLVSDLYHLEVTATVLDRCNELCAALAARHGA